MPLVICQLGNPRFFVFQIPEYKSIGGAGLDTGRRHVSLLQLLVRLTPLPFALADALHAECALLHDALRANGDIGIEVLPVRIVEIALPKVEETRVIRAVVSTISRPNAAIVDLDIQALLVMVCRVHGTYGLARRIVAVLTEHGQEARLHIGIFAFPIALDPNPVNRPLLQHDVLEIQCNVVFCMASDDTRLAAGTAVKVDHHTPPPTNACYRLAGVLLCAFRGLSHRRLSLFLVGFVSNLERLFIGHLYWRGNALNARQAGPSPG